MSEEKDPLGQVAWNMVMEEIHSLKAATTALDHRLNVMGARLSDLERPKVTLGEVVRDLGGYLRICPPELREQHYREALESAAKMLEEEIAPNAPFYHDRMAILEAARLVRRHRVGVPHESVSKVTP